MSRKKRVLIILVSIAAVILVAFLSYYAFAYSRVRAFTVLDNSPESPEGDTVEVDGVDIHYVKQGKSAEKIILVHGIGAGSFSYRYNIAELAGHYEVYALDLKGFGYSERIPGDDYSYKSQASIILGFMDEMDIGKATIAGHSMGGAISLLTYSMSPSSFDGLILIDSAGISSYREGLGFLITQPLVDILYYNLMVKQDNFKGFLSSAYYDKDFVDEELVDLYNRPFRVKDTNKTYLSILKSDNDHDFIKICNGIEVPVLIIWGEQDTWIDKDDGYIFDREIQDSTLVIIPESGHLPMEERSDEVNEAIIGFVEDKIGK